jgi:hypothetical protein
MINGLKRADCTLTKFYTLMEHGSNDNYHGKFIGIFGYKKLIQAIKSDMDKTVLNTVKSSAVLTGKLSDLKSSMNSYYNNLKTDTLPSADPNQPTARVIPQVLIDITVGVNKDIQQELQVLIDRYESYVEGAAAADSIKKDPQMKAKKTIDIFIKQLEQYESSFVKLRRLGRAAVNYEGRNMLLKVYVWFNLVLTILILVCFGIATTNSLKRRKHIKKSICC